MPTALAAHPARRGSPAGLVSRPDVTESTLQHINHEGILGVDVALNSEGKLSIIEANHAPSWQIFEQATGINVTQMIINRTIKRLKPQDKALDRIVHNLTILWLCTYRKSKESIQLSNERANLLYWLCPILDKELS